ncbi:MAG TPA: hypothetical protein VFT22_44160 [Kofleriaceae bacterium]|nr:hypothetical protein [Kofleriaceae bacterium]
MLRKRFERAKQRLKKLAIEHGLLQPGLGCHAWPTRSTRPA